MKLLVLGGTLFLGRHVVDAALARGHEVTLFNRGRRDVPWPEVETLQGDRDGGLDALEDRRWDAVVDTSGYVPRLVGASASKLARAVEHYTYISSVSVYPDTDAPGTDERAPVQTLVDPATEDVPANYGALKAASEHAAEAAMPGRVLHVRAGMIVGPFDATGRFAYWVRRLADGGEVLAPGDPDASVQLVHARDLADWVVSMGERRASGVFNVTGPERRLTMRDFLEACRDASGVDATFTWVDEDFLVANDVAAFADLPFWLTRAERGLLEVDVSKAFAQGLHCRPLVDTVRDTARWLAEERADGAVPARLASGVAVRAGIDRARERALLDAWHARTRRASTP